MSFKSEAAKVRANIAAGKYQKKPDYFGGFVEQVAYGIRKMDEEKRQEELEKRKAARAEARRIAEEQRKADRELKAQEKLINGYLTVKGYDPTDANKAAVRSVVVDLGITGFSDLDAVMKSNSTYLAGTPATGDVDTQMDDLVGTSGTIQFGKSEDKDPLEMSLDEVRYELSDPNLPASRRSVLERRQKSLIDPEQYTPTTLYKSDGSEVIARSLEEEQSYLKDGFSLVKGPEPADFADRVLYKDGAEVRVYSEGDYNTYTAAGWSPEKPAEAVEFKARTVYNEGTGQEREVFSQPELDAAIEEGFSATKPAPAQQFDDRVLYKDGAEVRVFSNEEYTTYVNDGWSPEKPAAPTPFVTRTLYAEDGREQVVTSQTEMDAAVNGGFSAIKPAATEKFTARKLYKDGGEVEVFSAEEETAYTNLGYSREKPPKQEGFKQRTLYSESGAQVEVFTQLEMQKYIEEGFSEVKPPKVEPFKQRTLYKGNKTVQVYSEDEYIAYLKQGFGSVKTDFVARTYYKDGQEKRILSEQEQERAEADGWSAVKLDDVAQIMADLEVDRKTAAQIQNGTLKLTTDFAGRPIIVDISSTTSQPVTPENGQTETEVPVNLDALLTQMNPNWKENGLSMMVNGEQITFTPEQIQNNESFKVTTDSLEGLNGAFGLSGVVNKLAGKAGDLVGAELRAEQNKAITFMGNLRLNTLINLAAAQAGGLRDSVWNKQQIIQTLPEPAKLFEGPFEARNKTNETLRSIQTSLRLIERAKQSGSITKSALSQATITEASLRELERTYQAVLKAFEASLGEPPKAQPSYIKKKSN
ncbi:hypothetical protein CRP738_gp21 [Roseobacter phage CRP-738]|nr:hypothetical protein CRP738_gp21 [Roseobacter phage CRP-738]